VRSFHRPTHLSTLHREQLCGAFVITQSRDMPR
jgi:hypothetical protein